jgi:predicted signal transduction protein with EAL and GGDEF domain
LAEVAVRINTALRTGDTAARLGGDEFAALLEGNPTEDDAASVANRVLAVLNQPFPLPGSRVLVGASVGAALSDSKGVGVDDLLKQADAAMYSAKGGGKGRYELFEPGMRAAVEEHVRMNGDIRLALDRSEFELHYQPIVQLEGTRVVGLEALVRWRHPLEGLLMPMDFLGAAEEAGHDLALGWWVLRQACDRMAEWRPRSAADVAPWVSVNLSPAQVQSVELVPQVAAALDKSGLPARGLVLELTEASLLPDVQVTLDRLSRLAEMGVRLALDGFGAGYSSLSNLRRLPVHLLKVDRSFLASADADSGDLGLVRGITRLGAEMGLDVVVVGVEHSWQLARLRRRQGLFGQGFLFSPAVAPDAVAAILSGGEKALR